MTRMVDENLSFIFGLFFFFFQAEDGIRDRNVTGVQTCALPIFDRRSSIVDRRRWTMADCRSPIDVDDTVFSDRPRRMRLAWKIGRASCRERVEMSVGDVVVERKGRGRGGGVLWVWYVRMAVL